MNIKRIWLVLPAMLTPYIVLSLWLGNWFSAEQNTDTDFLCPAFWAVGAVAVISVFCLVISYIKNWNALSYTKTIMIIKLLKIPGNILICATGILAGAVPEGRTIGFSLLLICYITILLTGLMNTVAVINANKQYAIDIKKDFWAIVLQFFFVTDVVSSIAFYAYLKHIDKKNQNV